MQSEIILGLIFHSKIIIAFSKIKDNSHLKQDRGLSKLRFIIIALLKAFNTLQRTTVQLREYTAVFLEVKTHTCASFPKENNETYKLFLLG